MAKPYIIRQTKDGATIALIPDKITYVIQSPQDNVSTVGIMGDSEEEILGSFKEVLDDLFLEEE
jgi:hypothetical protein